jgi:hypothetical protein
MSSSEEHGRDDLPLDDEQQASLEATGGGADGGFWGGDAGNPFADTTDWFSAELENVSASDWDIDTAQLWGDGSDPVRAEEDGESGLDFSL